MLDRGQRPCKCKGSLPSVFLRAYNEAADTLCLSCTMSVSLGVTMIARGSEADVDRSDVVLGALAAGGSDARYSPVQIQTLLFLIDREIPEDIGGPHFDFQPYHCGPYDPAVVAVAKRQAGDGKVVVDGNGPFEVYSLSEPGLREGLAALKRMPRAASRYVAKASEWVLSQTFGTLVSAIYRQYPDMAQNSRIPEAALRGRRRMRRRRMHPFLRGMASVVRIPHRARRDDSSEGTWAERDAIAIARSWRAVGDDLRFAIEQVNPVRQR